MHLPKPKEGCLQRLWAALGCAGWAIHTHTHNNWHGVGWDQEGKQKGGRLGLALHTPPWSSTDLLEAEFSIQTWPSGSFFKGG